ncbi:MAG: TetR family transcriptional regulator [Rubritalea sp.]|jgi:AcrR family transcriptional regulator|tara:strand:+ start:4555 stop:5181 length:627 start_codon:yes stop_codon:yes gene_type:complete
MKLDAKEKLIRSAIEVFAEQGYRDGKIANIVKGAGANIAAVNYHFGSKDQLFVAALRQAFADADEIYPSRGGLPDSASAEKKIAAVARAVLIRSFDEGKAGNFNRIMSRTMHVPGSPVEMILIEVEDFELKYLSLELAKFLETKCPQLIGWAVAIFISLATMISKCPLAVKEHLFSKEPKQSQINSMIEYQIEAIFAALRAIPKKFTS